MEDIRKINLNLEGIAGGDHELEVEFGYSVGNTGIGYTEYWGFPGYDRGHDVIEDIEIRGIAVRFANRIRKINHLLLEAVSLEAIEKAIENAFDHRNDRFQSCLGKWD